MKKVVFLILMLSASLARAQDFEGVISWKISMEFTDPKMKKQMEEAQKKKSDPKSQAQMNEMREKMNDPQFKAIMDANPKLKAQMEAAMKMMEGGDVNSMIPKAFIVKIKDKNASTLFEGGAIKMEVLYLHDKNASYKIDREAKTYSVLPQDTDDPNSKMDVKITKTAETLKVLDYTCTKYIVDVKSKGQTMQQFIWATTAIRDFDFKSLAQQRMSGNQQTIFYHEIEGVPLKTEMKTQQGNMMMEVTEIKKQSLPSSEFALPSGFKEVPSRFIN